MEITVKEPDHATAWVAVTTSDGLCASAPRLDGALRMLATMIEHRRDWPPAGPNDRTNDVEITLTHEQLCGFAFTVAGAASVPCMRDHPDYVMPTEELGQLVVSVLRDLGVEPSTVEGYERVADL